MYEAIVTLIVPAKEELVLGTGALLSRDRIEIVEPAHTEVYRLTFESEEKMRNWAAGYGFTKTFENLQD